MKGKLRIPAIRKLSLRVFLIVLVCLLIPFSLLVMYVRMDMENILRQEISERIVLNFSKSAAEVERVFTRMASISTIFFNDETLAGVFRDPDSSYYERTKAYNRVRSQIYSQDLYEYGSEYTGDVKVILRDQAGRLYTSWATEDTDSIRNMLAEPFVENCLKKQGFIFWTMNTTPIRAGDGTERPQIALARSMMDLQALSPAYATMIACVDQASIFTILNRYRYCEEDIVFATLGNGEVLFAGTDAHGDLLSLPLDKVTQDTPRLVQMGDKPYLLSMYRIQRISIFNSEELNVYYLTDYRQISQRIAQLSNQVALVSSLCLVAIALASMLISQLVASPMKALAAHIGNYHAGEKPMPLPTRRKDEVGDIYRAYDQMAAENYELLNNLRKEQGVREKYYLESLRSKMSPHFLFNTLTSIRWMAIIRNAPNIRNSIDALAAMLRYSLSEDTEYVTLSRELEVVENYCYIQEMRFGKNCRLEMRVPADLRQLYVIKFILQPIVENCFKHAFQAAEGNHLIVMDAHTEGEKLLVSVEDNGGGFSAEMIDSFNKPDAQHKKPDRLGIHIVDERIRISYGDGYGLRLENTSSGGARVIYCLPIRREEESHETDPDCGR